MKLSQRRWQYIGLLVALLALTYWCYHPGLTGDFHFDDRPNLEKLGSYNEVDSLEKLIVYLKSGIAGPTGRPISLLSFLLDTDRWPTEPRPLLHTNVLIHLLNGALLSGIFLILLRNARDPSLHQHAALIAVAAAGCWLLHPYLVSTTLYVVQRMAQLSALFSLLGILLYLIGRQKTYASRGQGITGTVWCILGVVLGTVLATLSKENGALLPLLILILEFAALRPLWGPPPKQAYFPIWSGIFLFVPALAVLGNLTQRGIMGVLSEGESSRNFTLFERLLTQPQILFEYLSNLLIPRPWYPGLFREQYPTATSLTDPPTTLLFVTALFLLILLAVSIRRRAPLFTTAILFFFAAHLIESSTIMLELFFEHRNYLPATFLFLPVVAWLFSKPKAGFLMIPAILLLALFTWQHARLWGQPVELYTYWSQRNPESIRAQMAAAGRLKRAQRPQEALAIITAALERNPDSVALRMFHLSLADILGVMRPEDVDRTVDAITSGPFDIQTPRIMEPMVDKVIGDAPDALPYDVLERLFQAFLSHDRYSTIRGSFVFLQYHRGRLQLHQGQGEKACQAFLAAFGSGRHVETGLQIAAILASTGYFQDAQWFLIHASDALAASTAEQLKFSKSWYEDEIGRLSDIIREDMAKEKNNHERICGHSRQE